MNDKYGGWSYVLAAAHDRIVNDVGSPEAWNILFRWHRDDADLEKTIAAFDLLEREAGLHIDALFDYLRGNLEIWSEDDDNLSRAYADIYRKCLSVLETGSLL